MEEKGWVYEEIRKMQNEVRRGTRMRQAAAIAAAALGAVAMWEVVLRSLLTG